MRDVFLASLAFILTPAVLHGQVDSILIRGSCSECDVRLQPIATLGGASLPFESGMTSFVAMMSDGRFVVAPTMNVGEIAIFRASGEYERVVGREGDGPGEYRNIRAVLVGADDTIRVVEPSRVTRLAPDFLVHRHGPSAAARCRCRLVHAAHW